MARRTSGLPLLGAATAAVLGAVAADVGPGEHPTHSAVLGAVALAVAVLCRRLGSGVVGALPAVAAALAVQPVLHYGSKVVRPAVRNEHENLLLHLLVDEGATAGVQIALPVLVLAAVAMSTRLVWLVVDAVRRPLELLSAPPTWPRPVLLSARPVAPGPMLCGCGWALLAARRGPPATPAHAAI